MSQRAGGGSPPVAVRLASGGGPGKPKPRFTRPSLKAIHLLALGFYAFLLFGAAVSVGTPWRAKALAWFAILVLVLLGWRTLRLAIMAKPDYLVIRNFRNTHRIPWREVEDIFRPGPLPSAVYLENPLTERKDGLYVRLKDGAVVSCALYSKSLMRRWPSNWALIDVVIANLNELPIAVYGRRACWQRRRRQCPRFAIVRPLGNLPESHVRVAE